MSQFDFVSVFFSIVFGLGLSQLLIGLMNDVSRRKVTEQQWVYSAFALSNVILNWWVVFKWRTVEEWPYEVFFLLVVWAIALFGMTIALYAPGEKDVLPFEQRKRMLLWAWLVFLVLDTVQIAAQGGLFSPWYVLPFILHYAVLAGAALYFSESHIPARGGVVFSDVGLDLELRRPPLRVTSQAAVSMPSSPSLR